MAAASENHDEEVVVDYSLLDKGVEKKDEDKGWITMTRRKKEHLRRLAKMRRTAAGRKTTRVSSSTGSRSNQHPEAGIVTTATAGVGDGCKDATIYHDTL